MKTLNIAILGAGMIGSAHASGYRAHASRFQKKGITFNLHTICDADKQAAENLTSIYGFEKSSSNWKEVINDPEIDVVSVTLPNFLHAEVTTAALIAGKHVLCEKPLSLTANEAEKLAILSESKKVICGNVFNYRRIPALAKLKEIIASGDIGVVRHVVVHYYADYAADEDQPFSWRYRETTAGGGALYDIGAHAIDIVRFLAGDIDSVVSAVNDTFIKNRLISRENSEFETGSVDTDDISSSILRLSNGATCVLTASRVSIGSGNIMSINISGSKGTARFNSERPGEIEIARLDKAGNMFTKLTNRSDFPYINEFTPVPHDGVSVGYAETFGFMIAEFLISVSTGSRFNNGSLDDGLSVLKVLEAIKKSARENIAVRI